MKYEIIVDHKESAKKCTIMPLRYREDFSIKKSRNPLKNPMTSCCLLHVDGIDLVEWAKDNPVTSIGLIDSTWVRLKTIEALIPQPLPQKVVLPKSFVTAYPRKNKRGEDPGEGLASIEALFIAAVICGEWDETLLDHYYFKDDFLRLNAEEFSKYR